MIHMSNSNSSVTATVTVIPRVEAEVIAEPKPMIVPTVRNSQLATAHMGYSKKTLFEGNGRTLLWDGLGKNVSEANSAMEVCRIAGLDYTVNTEKIYTSDGMEIPNMVATRRYDTVGDVEVPSTVYGVVTNRYEPVQNHKGFEFIDTLFGHNGFQVETAGQFDNGKIVWVEAKLPEKVMVGEKIMPYLVFTNRHDGKGSVKIFLTPVRVICKNTLNYAIKGAQGRSFSVTHTSSATQRLEQARQTIENYNNYLGAMETEIEKQKQILLEDKHFDMLVSKLFQFKETDTDRQKSKVLANREEVKQIYYNQSDLDGYEKSGFRFVNAVSDWATHNTSHRNTANYRGNLFQKTLNGNEFIDAAVDMINEFAPVANKQIAMGFGV